MLSKRFYVILISAPLFIFFRPTELDALVFGHLFTLLTTNLPNNEFARIIERFSNLKNFCERVDKTYFKDQNNDY